MCSSLASLSFRVFRPYFLNCARQLGSQVSQVVGTSGTDWYTEWVAKRHGLFHPSLTEGEDTPHSSPSQTGGLLSAATAPPLTTGAELETLTACTVPSVPAKAHLTTLLAGGWSCMSPLGDCFLRQATPGGQAAGGDEDKE